MIPDNYELCRIVDDLLTIYTFEDVITMIEESV